MKLIKLILASIKRLMILGFISFLIIISYHYLMQINEVEVGTQIIS